MLTIEIIEDLFEKTDAQWEGDNAFQGLMILNKYANGKDVLCAAEHDEIFSIGIDEAIENGLTLEDAQALANLNWSCDTDLGCFSCFV